MIKYLIGCSLLLLLCTSGTQPADAATNLSFTLSTSEPVTVDTSGGVPRLPLNVGGVTRYATYASGTGSSSLIFTYETQPGDLDLDGVALSSPLELNGGTIVDATGNSLSPLTFSVPATGNVKVDHPSLSMNFLADDYLLNGTRYSSLSSFLTAAGGNFSRASVATYYDSAGTLQTASANAPRFDYHPSTHAARGLLIEESRTNYTPNSIFTGIGPATYTAPQTTISNWRVDIPSGLTPPSTNLTPGTSGGIPYLDVRFQATNNSATTLYPTFIPLPSADVTVTNGEKTIGSAWMGVLAYSSTGGTCSVTLQNRSMTSGMIYITGTGLTFTSTAAYQYRTVPVQTHGATAGRAALWLFMSIPAGATCDITVRFGAPQFEKGDFATSFIPTSSGPVIRAADYIQIPTGTWFRTTEGTAAATLTPLIVSAGDFGGTAFNFNDGSGGNYMWGFVRTTGGQSRGEIVTSSVNQAAFLGTTNFAANSSGKLALAYKLNDMAFSGTGGAAVQVDGSGTIPAVNRLILGSREAGNSNRLNGYLEKFVYYPSRVANPQLQLLTQ